MSITMTCDWCGELIQGPDHATEDWLQIEAKANAYRREASGWIGQYHDRCWGDVEEALKLIHSHAPGLASIPVATDRELAAAGHPDRANRRGRGGDFRPAPMPVPADADLEAFINSFNAGMHIKLRRAFDQLGCKTLDEAAALTAEELMAAKGIGWTTVVRLRAYVAERKAAREAGQSSTTSTSVGGA
jgi:hypothetical protein